MINLNPNTYVEGGLPDDIDVEWKEIQFCQYDYNGNVPEPVLALGIKMTYPDPDKPGQAKEVDQYYSAGDLQYFVPSADGFSLEPVGTKTSVNNNTNFAKLMISLQQAANGALDEVLNSGSVGGLVGLRVHMNRMAQPKRSGIVRQGKNADKESTILLVSKINALPGQGGPATPAKTGLGAAKPVVAAAAPAKIGMGKVGASTATPPAPAPIGLAQPPNGDVDMLAVEVLMSLVLTSGGTIAKAKIPMEAFKHELLQGNPLKQRVVQRIYEDAFLSAVPGFAYNGGNVSMAE